MKQAQTQADDSRAEHVVVQGAYWLSPIGPKLELRQRLGKIVRDTSGAGPLGLTVIAWLLPASGLVAVGRPEDSVYVRCGGGLCIFCFSPFTPSFMAGVTTGRCSVVAIL
jgi:hypothetical protein